jgi:predicted naringenin-chalcone synthase
MAFHLTDHGFRMKLSAYVPRLLASQVEVFVDEALARSGISRADVRHWAVHPGSSKILDHVQDRLGLAPDALNCSRDVLRRYGNMSSATVLFVLDEIQRSDNPASGDYGMMMSFGPGLTMEATLVQWK